MSKKREPKPVHGWLWKGWRGEYIERFIHEYRGDIVERYTVIARLRHRELTGKPYAVTAISRSSYRKLKRLERLCKELKKNAVTEGMGENDEIVVDAGTFLAIAAELEGGE